MGGKASTPFFSSKKSSSAQACTSECCAQKDCQDRLVSSVEKRIAALSGKTDPVTGRVESPITERTTKTEAELCKRKIPDVEKNLARFKRYREALPYANAAEDMNGLSETPKPPSTKEPEQPQAKCITRLPVNDVSALNRELGLPEGTLKPRDLRDDSTGYRAAFYRDDTTGKIIMVSRDTQPTSLVDWQTNTRNGDGLDTPQYRSTRNLAGKLADHNVPFDISGYSKGGGLAQEAGLVSRNSKVFVFNSAGLHDNSLIRTQNASFDNLASRTQSFSAGNEFLTYMNETVDRKQQIENVKFLRKELVGDNRWEMFGKLAPMKIGFRNPENLDKNKDSKFQGELNNYLRELDRKIARMEADPKEIAFPPVRTGHKEVVANSEGYASRGLGSNSPEPSLGKLKQHLMENVTSGLRDTLTEDQQTLQSFLYNCG